LQEKFNIFRKNLLKPDLFTDLTGMIYR